MSIAVTAVSDPSQRIAGVWQKCPTGDPLRAVSAAAVVEFDASRVERAERIP